jgi:hypothetical protein
MTFKSFYLTESLQKVYHALDVYALNKLLKNNSFELSPNVSNVETEMGNDKYYFLSTMRNKSGSFFLGVSKDTKYPLKHAYLELDYDYLKSKMKSKPVDYWKAGRKNSEEEERFWTNDDQLTNVAKFIKAIHVFLRKDALTEHRKMYVNLYWQAKFKSIPLYFYDNPQNFVLGKKPLDLDFENELDYDRAKSDYGNDIEIVTRLMKNGKLTGKEVKRLKDKLRYPVYAQDFISQLSHEVHAGRKMADGANREYIKDFVDLMMKYKRKSVKEFVEKDVMEKMFERKLLYKN